MQLYTTLTPGTKINNFLEENGSLFLQKEKKEN